MFGGAAYWKQVKDSLVLTFSNGFSAVDVQLALPVDTLMLGRATYFSDVVTSKKPWMKASAHAAACRASS
jgi:hypothetical protein